MGVPTPLLAALGGYLFTYYNTKITEERKAQIERINQQVRDLYGPLLATVNASRSAYSAMVRAHAPPGSSSAGRGAAAAAFVRAVREDPAGSTAKVYRTWMRDVLQPLNERAAAIVVDHADLLESSHMPSLLLQLVAHVSANRVVLSRWASGELDAASAIAYPDGLHSWASEQFRGIKARQALLLGVKSGYGGSGSAGGEEFGGGGGFDDFDADGSGGGSGSGRRAFDPLAPSPPLQDMEEGAWGDAGSGSSGADPLVAVSSKL